MVGPKLRGRSSAVYYIPFLISCAALYWLSDMSHPPIPSAMRFKGGDKVLHAAAFFIVGLAAAFAAASTCKDATNRTSWPEGLQALLLCMIYGALDEIHQIFIPLRNASYEDWLADVLGASLGILCFFSVRFFIKARKK